MQCLKSFNLNGCSRLNDLPRHYRFKVFIRFFKINLFKFNILDYENNSNRIPT
jgi:hypothetical protein